MAKNSKKPKPKSKPKADVDGWAAKATGLKSLGDLQKEDDALLLDIEEGTEIAQESIDAVLKPKTDDRISMANLWETLSIQALALADNLKLAEEVRRKGLARQIAELRKNLKQSKPKIKK